MKRTHELLGYENIKIIQDDDMFSFSVDSMLLASFVCTNKKVKRIVDLGCGNAPIPLFLTLKTDAKIIGVEIQKELADMALESVKLNNFTNQIEIVNKDMKNIYTFLGANSFDIVTSNPPYFKYQETSNINKNEFLTIARHEVMVTLNDVVREAKKLLCDGGMFYMVHRCERFPEVVDVVTKNCFEIKRVQFVYPKSNSKEALMVLIEAKKNGKSGMKVIEPLYIYEENNTYTEEVRKIFNFKSTK